MRTGIALDKDNVDYLAAKKSGAKPVQMSDIVNDAIYFGQETKVVYESKAKQQLVRKYTSVKLDFPVLTYLEKIAGRGECLEKSNVINEALRTYRQAEIDGKVIVEFKKQKSVMRPLMGHRKRKVILGQVYCDKR